MSHFTVLVIGDDIEKQLQPYHEFECTGVNDEFVQDVDVTEECRENGLDWHGLEDSVVQSEEEVDRNGKHKFGYAIQRDGELIKAVNRTNPNKKWDWWLIGGRWTGFFRLKDGASGSVGRPGLMTKEAEAGRADQARKGDIDFEAMRDSEAKQAAEQFDKYAPAFNGKDIPSWDECRERHNGDVDAAREEYSSHPVIKAINDLQSDPFDLWGAGCRRSYFANGDRAAFIDRARASAVAPFAVVKDGQWHQKGDMGWFGMAANEKSQEDWNQEFHKVLDALPDDTLLTVVDCHI